MPFYCFLVEGTLEETGYDSGYFTTRVIFSLDASKARKRALASAVDELGGHAKIVESEIISIREAMRLPRKGATYFREQIDVSQ